MNKVYEEFGKFFLNVSVAVVVFVFIKPIVEGEFNAFIGSVFGIVIFMLLFLAYFSLKKAGGKNEWKRYSVFALYNAYIIGYFWFWIILNIKERWQKSLSLEV